MGKFERIREDANSSHDGPPKTVDAIIGFLESMKPRRPHMMPLNNADAAMWWMSIVEPGRDSERPQQTPVSGGGQRWECPYTMRIMSCLRKFVSLTEQDQRWIVASREDGIYWRGDDMDFFAMVIKETERMKNIGAGEYRKQALSKMKQIVGRTVIA